jgi:hypothetical protein
MSTQRVFVLHWSSPFTLNKSFGVSGPRRTHVDRACAKTGCWVQYLDLKGEDVTEGWGQLYHEEIQNIIRIMKSKRMR